MLAENSETDLDTDEIWVDPTPYSETVPLVDAFLICDTIVEEPNTGKLNLIGIFDHIYSAGYPDLRFCAIYVKLRGAEGRYVFKFDWINTATGELLDQMGWREETFGEGSLSVELQFNVTGLDISGPGTYECRLWVNDVLIGTTTVVAEQGEPPTRDWIDALRSRAL